MIAQTGMTGKKEPSNISDNSAANIESAPNRNDTFISETSTAGADNIPKYENTLNIGEIKIAEGVSTSQFYCVPPLFEMSRGEILEHFGLSEEFELSGIVPELREVMLKDEALLYGAEHGLHRGCTALENGDLVWEEVTPMWDNDEFWFKSADGSQSARVIFQRKYSADQVIPGFCSGIYTALNEHEYSTEPFYALPPSIIAGVEMRIAKRSTGGYYAEFGTGSLCVGLDTRGISEEKTVAILEYLAEYVGAASSSEDNIHIDGYNDACPLLLF